MKLRTITEILKSDIDKREGDNVRDLEALATAYSTIEETTNLPNRRAYLAAIKRMIGKLNQ